jgi:hypothetical protein
MEEMMCPFFKEKCLAEKCMMYVKVYPLPSTCTLIPYEPESCSGSFTEPEVNDLLESLTSIADSLKKIANKKNK